MAALRTGEIEALFPEWKVHSVANPSDKEADTEERQLRSSHDHYWEDSKATNAQPRLSQFIPCSPITAALVARYSIGIFMSLEFHRPSYFPTEVVP